MWHARAAEVLDRLDPNPSLRIRSVAFAARRESAQYSLTLNVFFSAAAQIESRATAQTEARAATAQSVRGSIARFQENTSISVCI